MAHIEIRDPNLKQFLQHPFSTLKNLKGIVHRSQPGRITIEFEHNAQRYFAKIHNKIGWKEIFKNLFQLRLPIISAKTEWNALIKLQKLAIPSPIPVAFGTKGLNPSCIQSFIVTKALPDSVNLEDFFKKITRPSFTFKKEIIEKVAAIAKKLHDNGINHRDFYLCHFLLDKQDMRRVYLIDLHRAQIRKKVPLRWRIKDISGLYFSTMNLNFTQRDYLRFLKGYFDRPLRSILKKEQSILKKIQKKAITLYQKHSSR